MLAQMVLAQRFMLPVFFLRRTQHAFREACLTPPQQRCHGRFRMRVLLLTTFFRAVAERRLRVGAAVFDPGEARKMLACSSEVRAARVTNDMDLE